MSEQNPPLYAETVEAPPGEIILTVVRVQGQVVRHRRFRALGIGGGWGLRNWSFHLLGHGTPPHPPAAKKNVPKKYLSHRTDSGKKVR